MIESIFMELLAFFLGSFLSFITFLVHKRRTIGSYEKIAKQIIEKAEKETESLRRNCELQLKQNHVDQQREFEQQWQIEKRKLVREEERIKAREDKLEGRVTAFERKITDVEKREAVLLQRKSMLDAEKESFYEQQRKLAAELEIVSGLSSQEAREILLDRLTNDVKTEAANLMRRIKKEAEEEAEKHAQKVIVTAINRLAVSCVSESTVSTVSIPNDEFKGRVIGREGRNIRTLEKLTGINFVIDDTPGAIVLSGFDPMRMEIAKTALKELMHDGRIHPTRIEEVVEKAKIEVNKRIRQYGEDAVVRAGIMNLHPELIYLLGKLKLRYSLGQNVLDHSLEVSHIMGMMAAEIGLNPRLAKRIGLLHDIGKAVSHEIEGTHAIIGHDFALKYGESKEVANGIGCHHFEMEALTLEAALCSAADAISASRLGGRCEAVEEYIKRLNNLEKIAYSFDGIQKAYAMQAGRELLILVVPEKIQDTCLQNLTGDIAKKIESEMTYPGRIKVTLVRETRMVEYAN